MDWRTRIHEKAVRMSQLLYWQNHMDKYDKFVQKIMAIRELGDLPYEVWMDLIASTEKVIPWAQKFGTCEYTHSIQNEAVTYAMAFYAKAFKDLHEIQSYKQAKFLIDSFLFAEDNKATTYNNMRKNAWKKENGWINSD